MSRANSVRLARRFGPPCAARPRQYNPHMRFTHAQKVVSGWIALIAILAGSLAPAVSSARSVDSQVISAGDFCTVHVDATDFGKANRSHPPSTPGQTPARAKTFEHCPYCSAHALHVALPPAQKILIAVVETRDDAPIYRAVRPAQTRTWRFAPSRAPPLPA